MIGDDFKNVLACWASGVSVVTTRVGDLVYGLTVSSFASLSLDPPLVLVCVANRNRLPAMIHDAGRFAVSLLATDQRGVSGALARSGREPAPDLGVAERPTDSGVPVVADAIAHLACDLHAEFVAGDHTIIVGHVTEAVARPDREPLVYWCRRYREVSAVEDPLSNHPLELWGFAL